MQLVAAVKLIRRTLCTGIRHVVEQHDLKHLYTMETGNHCPNLHWFSMTGSFVNTSQVAVACLELGG